jgi:hypothetical protein
LTACGVWARDHGWEVIGITTLEGKTVVRLAGPLPRPDAASLRDAIAARGVDVADVRAEFVPTERVDFADDEE